MSGVNISTPILSPIHHAIKLSKIACVGITLFNANKLVPTPAAITQHIGPATIKLCTLCFKEDKSSGAFITFTII